MEDGITGNLHKAKSGGKFAKYFDNVFQVGIHQCILATIEFENPKTSSVRNIEHGYSVIVFLNNNISSPSSYTFIQNYTQ